MRNTLLPILMSSLIWAVAGFAVFIAGRTYELQKHIQQIEAVTPDAEGIIHHPKYGDYPAEVPYHHGMTLKPGQTARGVFEFNRNEKGN